MSPTKPSGSTRAKAIRRLLFRIASFIGGASILYHEVAITDNSETILDLIALYLMGVPTADLVAHVTHTLGSGSHSRKNKDKGSS